MGQKEGLDIEEGDGDGIFKSEGNMMSVLLWECLIFEGPMDWARGRPRLFDVKGSIVALDKDAEEATFNDLDLEGPSTRIKFNNFLLYKEHKVVRVLLFGNLLSMA